MALVSSGETWEFAFYKRIPNTPYIDENHPTGTFKGRPAGTLEKRKYHVQTGVNGGTDSVYIVATNLPVDIKDGDKVKFMGKIWMVASVGYYYDQSKIINASIMSEQSLIERCPKGLQLQ